MRVQIKQTLVRWVSCEIDPANIEHASTLDEEQLEHYCWDELYDTVQEEGWDGEDVLEESCTLVDD